jgi:hypothetical protein
MDQSLLPSGYQVTVKNTFLNVSVAQQDSEYSKSAPASFPFASSPDTLPFSKMTLSSIKESEDVEDDVEDEHVIDTKQVPPEQQQQPVTDENPSHDIKETERNESQKESHVTSDLTKTSEYSAKASLELKKLLGVSQDENTEPQTQYKEQQGTQGIYHKDEFSLDLDAIISGQDRRTTLMIKNIPNKYSQKMLLESLDKYRGRFDFFYVPIDLKKKCNVGYAFINFVISEYITDFYREFNGQTWEKFNSQKVCSISYARIQGKQAMISHFQNSRLLAEDRKCRPLIFRTDGTNAGEEEEFPVGPNFPFAKHNPSSFRNRNRGYERGEGGQMGEIGESGTGIPLHHHYHQQGPSQYPPSGWRRRKNN